MTDPLLARAGELASRYLDSLDERFVGPCPDSETLVAALGGPVPERGAAPLDVIDDLARDADPGLVASQGGRFFGFVVGGAHPASLAADWLVSAWDQNVGFYVLSPASAAIEEVTSAWLLDLLGLPDDMTVGFVTGCQMANFMGLCAARQRVLTDLGWNVAADGLIGAPCVRLVTSAESHGTIDRALAMLGLGADRAERVPCDGQGRMQADALAAMLDRDGPTIVCAQAGNVDTGAFDPLETIGPLCRERNAWLHVDGAFGLWAAASPRYRRLTRGIEHADSIATDAHKWLNVPYDAGVVIVRDRAALLASGNYRGDYLVRGNGRRDSYALTPESSRRARATPIYAAIRELGRSGVAELVDRCCAHAQRAADRLAGGGATILNDVVLNQVLFVLPGSDTGAVIDRVQRDGTCWLGGTTRQGTPAIRLSVSGWRTTGDDIDRAVDAILAARGASPATSA